MGVLASELSAAQPVLRREGMAVSDYPEARSTLEISQEPSPAAGVDLRRSGPLRPVVVEDPVTFDVTATGLAEAGDSDWLVVLDDDGRPCGAVCRRCPHAGFDLATSGRQGSRPGTLACRHRRYEWDRLSGAFLGDPSAPNAFPLELAPVSVDADGTVWIPERRPT